MSERPLHYRTRPSPLPPLFDQCRESAEVIATMLALFYTRWPDFNSLRKARELQGWKELKRATGKTGNRELLKTIQAAEKAWTRLNHDEKRSAEIEKDTRLKQKVYEVKTEMARQIADAEHRILKTKVIHSAPARSIMKRILSENRELQSVIPRMSDKEYELFYFRISYMDDENRKPFTLREMAEALGYKHQYAVTRALNDLGKKYPDAVKFWSRFDKRRRPSGLKRKRCNPRFVHLDAPISTDDHKRTLHDVIAAPKKRRL